MPVVENDRLSKSIISLIDRIQGLPERSASETRIKLIADVRTTAIGAVMAKHFATRQWMEIAADILERALYVRAGERRVLEEFARKALQLGLEYARTRRPNDSTG